MTKIYGFAERNTAPGNATWGGTVPVLNDANHNTEVILATTNHSAYVNTLDGLKRYIANGAHTASDATMTQAGNKPELAGAAAFSSAFYRQFETAPGKYKFRIATGTTAAIATPSRFALFKGNRDTVRARWPGSLLPWSSGMALVNGTQSILSSVDNTVWTINHTGAGVAGAVEPSGSGATFNDGPGGAGGKVWSRVNYANGEQLIALYYHRATHNGASTIGETGPTPTHGGSPVAAASWGTVECEIEFTGSQGNSVFLERLSGVNGYLRYHSYQEVLPTLVDVALYDEFSDPLGTTLNPWCHERLGLQIARISQVNGAVDMQIVGPDAAYLGVQMISGQAWIVSTAMKPDAAGGTAVNASVRQTDATAEPTTHDTPISGVWQSSQGKPTTGIDIWRSAESWPKRKQAFTVFDAVWPGAVGPADNIVTCNSGATLKSVIEGLAHGPANTVKHEVRVQDGTYTGYIQIAKRDYGSGWVRIVRAPGHNPIFRMSVSFICRKVHWNLTGILWANNPATMAGQTYCLQCPSPGTGGINNDGTGWAVIQVDNPTMGVLVDPTLNATDYRNWVLVADGLDEDNWQFLSMGHGESVVVRNAKFYGMRACIVPVNVRCVIAENCDVRRIKADFLPFKSGGTASDVMGVFPDDNMHVLCRRTSYRDCIDEADWVTTAHQDVVQQQRVYTEYNWAANGGGRVVNDLFAVYEKDGPQRVYRVVSTTGAGLFGATPPVGTVVGTDETNGDLVVEYVHTIPVIDVYLVFEDNDMTASAPARGGAPVQNQIDSNSGRGQRTWLIAFNNVSCTVADIGYTIGGPGKAWVDQCTMISPSEIGTRAETLLPAGQGIGVVRDGKIRSTGCVVEELGYFSLNHNAAAARKFDDHSTIVRRLAPGEPSPLLTFAGPFETVASGPRAGWRHFPALDDSGLNSPEAYRQQLRSMLRTIDGSGAGIVSGWEPYADPEVVLPKGEWVTLTKEQFELLEIRVPSDAEVGASPMAQIRWRRGGVPYAALDGVDVIVDVS